MARKKDAWIVEKSAGGPMEESNPQAEKPRAASYWSCSLTNTAPPMIPA